MRRSGARALEPPRRVPRKERMPEAGFGPPLRACSPFLSLLFLLSTTLSGLTGVSLMADDSEHPSSPFMNSLLSIHNPFVFLLLSSRSSFYTSDASLSSGPSVCVSVSAAHLQLRPNAPHLVGSSPGLPAKRQIASTDGEGRALTLLGWHQGRR